MKATLTYSHKAKIKEHYILEMKVHKVARSTQYPEGVKYGLIFTDLKTDQKILMDNHHPKGHHIHINNKEISYEYVDLDRLIKDFKELVLENMGEKI
jgi:hypothetical protein